MLDLRELIAPYRTLVRETLKQFELENDCISWSCYAFDCAPAHGRLGLNFDTTANSDSIVSQFEKNGPDWYGEDVAGRFNNNCADFAFCRYRDLHLYEDWVVPWEADAPFHYVDLEGSAVRIEQDQFGDEGFNSIIFPVLLRVRDLEIDWVRANSRKREPTSRFGVQMCDSKFEEFSLL